MFFKTVRQVRRKMIPRNANTVYVHLARIHLVLWTQSDHFDVFRVQLVLGAGGIGHMASVKVLGSSTSFTQGSSTGSFCAQAGDESAALAIPRQAKAFRHQPTSV